MLPAGGISGARLAASPTSRQMRWTNRQMPCTPSGVQMTSRSGGESDSMNQRAVSAPKVPVTSSRPTVLRFDFDIFSIGPISTGSPVAISAARRCAPVPSIFTSAGCTQPPSAVR